VTEDGLRAYNIQLCIFLFVTSKSKETLWLCVLDRILTSHMIKKATVLPCIGKGSKNTMGKKSKKRPSRDKASNKSLSPGGTKVCLARP
jgi:hypothetical protein